MTTTHDEHTTVREYAARVGYNYHETNALRELTREWCYAAGLHVRLAERLREEDGTPYVADTYPVAVMASVPLVAILDRVEADKAARANRAALKKARLAPEREAAKAERAARKAAEKPGKAPKLAAVVATTRDPAYLTAAEFLKRVGVKLVKRDGWLVPTKYGKAAAKLCRERGIAPRKEHRDRRKAPSAVYPLEILREVHAEID